MFLDVAVIGGGPAGLTAALYSARSGLKTTVFEKFGAGGKMVMTEKIENYPGFPDGITGYELAERMSQQAWSFGAGFINAEVKFIEPSVGIFGGISGEVSYFIVRAGSEVQHALAVIIATGSAPRKLGVEGEEKLRGRGISYCVTCDAPLFKGKDVAVIGGGDSAAQETLHLARFARKIYLIHRREKLRASGIIARRVESESKVEFVLNSIVEEFVGRDFLTHVRVRNAKTSDVREIQVSGAFVCVGLDPATDFVRGLVDMDDAGYIITDDTMATTRLGIFAAGDCRKKILHQVVNACGEGAMAAFSAQRYVETLKGTACWSQNDLRKSELPLEKFTSEPPERVSW